MIDYTLIPLFRVSMKREEKKAKEKKRMELPSTTNAVNNFWMNVFQNNENSITKQ